MTTLPQTFAKISALVTRPELELILSCARTQVDAETIDRIKILLQQELNWDYLLKTAFNQGVMPLLSHNLI